MRNRARFVGSDLSVTKELRFGQETRVRVVLRSQPQYTRKQSNAEARLNAGARSPQQLGVTKAFATDQEESVKRIVKFGALAAVGAFALSGCGEAPDKEAPEEAASGDKATAEAGDHSDVKACMVSDSGGFDDRSFNQSGHDGLKRAESELGVSIRDAESNSEADFVPNIDSMVQEGCDIIIGVGFLMVDAMSEAAEAHPEVKFALVDAGFNEEYDNAKPLLFNTAEASFLAGYAAAGISETGKVGAFLGMNLPSTAIFADGYADGVQEYNEENDADVEVLGWNKADQDGMATGDFDDISKGKQFSQQLIEQGADVIMPVAGPVGTGALAAAKEADDVAVVWVDADGFETQPEYAEYILTSVLKDISYAVFDAIEMVVNDDFNSEPYIGTLENHGVGIAPWHDFEDKVSPELKDEIDDLRERIIDGSLVVETENTPK